LLEDIIKENKEINMKLSNANNQLRELSLIDELTGIANRRSFRNFIDMSFENIDVKTATFSAIMTDIDFFKAFNDNYGHIEGDRVLIKAANEINSVAKNPLEFVVRWGGEEFLYAAFNKSDEYIKQMAQKIQSKISQLKIPHKYSYAADFLSISIGVFTSEINCKNDVGKVIEMADEMMYEAKREGRNKIIIKSDHDTN
jgi:diguanylate cyclase (GGDEF)-like protein